MGSEIDDKDLSQFGHTHGMVFRLSCPHTSSQNGKVKHLLHTLNNISRTLINHATIPSSFLPHALSTAAYLYNIIPLKTLQYATSLS